MESSRAPNDDHFTSTAVLNRHACEQYKLDKYLCPNVQRYSQLHKYHVQKHICFKGYVYTMLLGRLSYMTTVPLYVLPMALHMYKRQVIKRYN